jgi:hypothetical protein
MSQVRQSKRPPVWCEVGGRDDDAGHPEEELQLLLRDLRERDSELVCVIEREEWREGEREKKRAGTPADK